MFNIENVAVSYSSMYVYHKPVVQKRLQCVFVDVPVKKYRVKPRVSTCQRSSRTALYFFEWKSKLFAMLPIPWGVVALRNNSDRYRQVFCERIAAILEGNIGTHSIPNLKGKWSKNLKSVRRVNLIHQNPRPVLIAEVTQSQIVGDDHLSPLERGESRVRDENCKAHYFRSELYIIEPISIFLAGWILMEWG